MMLRDFRAKSVQVLRELRALTAPDWQFLVTVMPLSSERDIGYVVTAENTSVENHEGSYYTIVTRVVHTLEVLRFGKIYQVALDMTMDDKPLNTVLLYRNQNGQLFGEPPLVMDSVIDLDTFKRHILLSLPQL